MQCSATHQFNVKEDFLNPFLSVRSILVSLHPCKRTCTLTFTHQHEHTLKTGKAVHILFPLQWTDKNTFTVFLASALVCISLKQVCVNSVTRSQLLITDLEQVLMFSVLAVRIRNWVEIGAGALSALGYANTLAVRSFLNFFFLSG